MVDRKSFPLRMPNEVFDALERWANDDLRSLNAQIEYLVRDALKREQRLKPKPPSKPDGSN